MKQIAKKDSEKKIMGYRKSCKVKGTGLSHYILIDKSKNKA